MEIIEQVCQREGPATKFLIFTEFTATQRILKQTLKDLGYQVVLINCSMDINERIIARQQLTPTYFRNGAAYAITRSCLLEQRTILGARSGAVIVDEPMVSIDTLADFDAVESILKARA